MTTIIAGFALVYKPVEEKPELLHEGPKQVRFFGGIADTVIQANDMPPYLQEAIIKYLQEKHKDVRFKRNDPSHSL